jgi:hypothetical protein
LGNISLEQLGRVLLATPLSYFLEQEIVHGPEGFSSLLGNAEGSFSRWPRLGVDTFKWELKENLFDFACGDVRFIQKRARL